MRVVILALVALILAGFAGCAEDEPGEVEPTAVETGTVTETEVVPDACIDAIIGLNSTLGEYHNSIVEVVLEAMAEGMGISGDFPTETDSLASYERVTDQMIDSTPYEDISACFEASDRSGEYLQLLDVWPEAED